MRQMNAVHVHTSRKRFSRQHRRIIRPAPPTLRVGLHILVYASVAEAAASGESDITHSTRTGSVDYSGTASRLISWQGVCIDPFLGLATRTEVQHPERHMAVRPCGGKAEVGRYGDWERG